MKKILYFSIGFAIPFIWFSLAYSAQIYLKSGEENPYPVPATQTQPSSGYETPEFHDSLTYIPAGTDGWYPSSCGSACTYSSGCYQVQTYGKRNDGPPITYSYKNVVYINPSCDQSSFQSTPVLPDADGDGRPDKYDAYPNDPGDYQFQIVSRYYDSNGNCIGYMIYTSKGDYILMSDLTLDQLNTGLYTDHTLTSEFVNSDIWQDSSDLIPGGGGGTTTDTENTPSGNSNTPITTTDATRLISDAQRDTTAQTPTTPAVPGSGTSDSQGRGTGDSDSDSLGKIVGNTDASNQNLKGIGEALGITNDLLAKINAKTKSGSGNGTGTGTSGSDLTAEDIGSAVGDALIDSGQTIDTTTTDNITSLDETDTLTEIKTKYSDRYDLFINTLKGSDLFTEPFDIFTGPSGSGSSVLSVNIGSWGQSSSRSVTIDFSQYDNVWNILSSVLLMLTSFACFKIIVLKKA